MAERECVRCGLPVPGGTCPACGTPVAADAPDDAAAPTGAGESAVADRTGVVPAGAMVLPVEDDDDDPAALRTAEQPWHPFEQPSWLDAAADPREVAPGGFAGADGRDFMGVSAWQVGQDAAVAEDRRRPWLLGALAAVAVVIVLGAAAFFLTRGGSPQAAPPDAPAPSTVVTVTAEPTDGEQPVAGTGAPAATGSPTAGTDPSPSPTSSPSEGGSTAEPAPATTDPAADPMGGPSRDIACAPGWIVQIASAGDDAAFAARVAELRAANQLPADVAVARTASSCAIFTGQTNSVVLYAGPFGAPYDGCPARLAGAPDAFIKGTTPETATEYVSCLCPAQIVTVPDIDEVGQTGVWVGELQRVLGNGLNLPIADLDGNWGTYTAATADAVRAFQTRTNLPVTGTVDAGTWQALQQAQC